MTERHYWRSLEELTGSDEWLSALRREFPENADSLPPGLDRRRFLQLVGASFALAGLGACTRQPVESIIPYTKAPEEIIPGKPLYFASALTLGGFATGVLVESHMGRPTKVEGNPEHPASLGSTDRFVQAALLDLYDPDRSRAVVQLGRIRSWEAFLRQLEPALSAQEGLKGAGLRILTGSTTSPTVAAQMRLLRQRFPEARWHRHEAVSRDGLRSATLAAFGRHLEIRYDFSQADVIVGLDSDFLTTGPGCVRYAYECMRRRRVRDGQYGMNRFYAIESTPSATGAVADHRLSLAPEALLGFAYGLAYEAGVHGTGRIPAYTEGELGQWLQQLGLDLRRNPGRTIVIAGDESPVEMHALAMAMNVRLGNFGHTVFATQPIEVEPVNQGDSLRELTDDMRAGRVEILLALGANPVYDAPADLGFAAALDVVPLRVHLGLHENETSDLCHWHIPMAHELEAWGDARAFDGTATIQQPLIEPLYGGKSIPELLAQVTGQSESTGLEIVQRTWRETYSGVDFESYWKGSLHDGVVPGSAFEPLFVEYQRDAILGMGVALARDLGKKAQSADTGVTVVFRTDPSIYDGRFANNGWLQELPKPWTRLTWDNAALMAPSTAARLGLAQEEVVRLESGGAQVEAPVWLLPGQPDDVVTLHLGYGRRRVGRVGAGAGFDAFPLRRSSGLASLSGVKVGSTGKRLGLACTQEHSAMEGRHLVRQGTLQEFRRNPHFASEMEHAPGEDMSLYPGFQYEGHAWGMVVDLGACTGCMACVVACNAENNIPVVGKEQVRAGREMHWLRIDRYFEGDPHNPKVAHQPVMCQQCENAPCEPVCPVGATVHGKEGLNEMVYNRCVGTRYCSNNCPYKVRRFNFLQFADRETEILKMMRNPDVTVRTRGVMEKCTYCVQRINEAKIQGKKEGRDLRDGEILTACQQVCPTDALIFGDINDSGSKVAALRRQPMNYSILAEVNTRPRTTYLARIANPNPDLASLEAQHAGGDHGD